ncbi:TATA box-binding protein-associated factor, RNA polymerase I, subunit C-like [Thamnophis elegans]|uniref:TATA box-binding protein-associated factor, RNA polymerase I, subunit C-like n=1 Tax=Thamnophis elegans TaxID=35005 RepID=UPI001378D0B7|nr:TATA box-binding protein-associated factor, RNA polymerase I, subunit C-like [Thamnophis elegans]XP_032069527.1 TATA box-binding protein-associated factor, RNA polymerase I, subunit C-like [Thamnophis elegans]
MAHHIPAGPGQHSHKVLLGAHHSQEMLLLQYSGIAAALGQKEGIQTLLVFQLSQAGDLFYQLLLPQANGEAPTDSEPETSVAGAVVGRPCQDPISADGAKTTCTPAAATLYRRWLRSWKRAALPTLYWQCPPATLNQGCLFAHREPRDTEGASPSSVEASCRLRGAMREEQLFCSWGDERGVPVPPAPQLPPGELSQRLEASWAGDWAAWWLERLGATKARRQQELREQRRRAKRRRGTQSLSGSFTSSTSYQSELSDWSGDGRAPRPPPALPAEPPAQAPPTLPAASQGDSQELLSSQSLSARGIPHERRQTLRRYTWAVLDQPPEPPEEPLSASHAQCAAASGDLPLPSGPQPKRGRMGFEAGGGG